MLLRGTSLTLGDVVGAAPFGCFAGSTVLVRRYLRLSGVRSTGGLLGISGLYLLLQLQGSGKDCFFLGIQLLLGGDRRHCRLQLIGTHGGRVFELLHVGFCNERLAFGVLGEI